MHRESREWLRRFRLAGYASRFKKQKAPIFLLQQSRLSGLISLLDSIHLHCCSLVAMTIHKTVDNFWIVWVSNQKHYDICLNAHHYRFGAINRRLLPTWRILIYASFANKITKFQMMCSKQEVFHRWTLIEWAAKMWRKSQQIELSTWTTNRRALAVNVLDLNPAQCSNRVRQRNRPVLRS